MIGFVIWMLLGLDGALILALTWHLEFEGDMRGFPIGLALIMVFLGPISLLANIFNGFSRWTL